VGRWRSFFEDPLRGKTSLSSVIWLYGILGSVIYGAIGLLFDVGNERAMQAYTILGLLYSIYVTVATYQSAVTCKSAGMRRLVRVCAVLSLLLLPLLAYLDLSGALDLTSLRGEQ
jgi:hypothetical protein